jgi:hypothetical protein
MTMLASETARKYKAAFEECCRLHDELMDFANRTQSVHGRGGNGGREVEGASLQFAKPLPVRMNTIRSFVVVEIH